MPKLKIVLACPEVRRIDRPDVTWLLTGCSEADAARLEQSGNERNELEAEICARAGDATIIKVIHDGGRLNRVGAWRGPTAMHEVFRLEKSNGDLFVSDNFRSLLARLPIGERTPSDDAIIDHFLFRTTPGHNAYCRSVKRLGHGERIMIELASGESTNSLFQKLDENSEPRSISEYLDDVDQALDDVLSPFKQREDITNLFSGGIDSTVIQTYLDPKTAALNLATDAKGAAATMEANYARTAASLLGATVQRQEVCQSEFLRDLELATEDIAMPIQVGRLAVFARAFSNDYDNYITGQNADSLFGLSVLFRKIASLFANPLVLRCLTLSARAIARKDLARRNIWRERLELLLPSAQELSADPDSMLGFGARSETFSEFDLAEMIFGEEAISRRLEKRFDYVTEHVALLGPSGNKFLRHLEIGSWIDSLCSDYALQLRHLAMANKKSVLFPYLSGPVVRSALRIPVKDRYIQGFEGKYVLKRLLKRRLPGYPTGQRKGTTALVNFPQYYRTGPLSKIWGSYEMPDFIPSEARNRIRSMPLNISYSAANYAIWKRRVLENTRLEPLAFEQSYEWAF